MAAPGSIAVSVLWHYPADESGKGRAMKARVYVTLKNGVLDPQGKAIEGALGSLGVAGVSEVRQGKMFDIVLADGLSKDKAEDALRTACEKLLANTVVENFRYEVIG
jgi:phosphoribosylformylglycinamidine synthase subunit PurS